MRGLAMLGIAAGLAAGCVQRPADLVESGEQPVPSGSHQDWQLAFTRNDDLFIAKLENSASLLIAKSADSPVWSSDGRLLAFRQGDAICVWNAGKKESRVLFRGKEVRETGPSGYGLDDLKMTFDPIRPMLVAAIGPGLKLIPLEPKLTPRDILKQMDWIEDSPVWSPSGSNLAFTRSGDIWIALRDVLRWKNARQLDGGLVDDGGFTVDYYDDARRLAPLAVWNDGEVGVSARTPFWVDDLAWTQDEKRLVFHFQRVGGSGISQVGYLELDPVAKPTDWGEDSGFRVETHWITPADETTLFPAICPDGKSLSFVRDDYLWLSDWDGMKRSILLKDVWQYAWRPKTAGNP